MRDFTLVQYSLLLRALVDTGYRTLSFSEFIEKLDVTDEKVVVLRHDVDRKPVNSLITARIESNLNLTGTYYFRIVPGAWDEGIIKKIHKLGHECGYHYEDLDLAAGDQVAAYLSFEQNLERLRTLVPVKTICMHGSPMSRWDNRDLWRTNDRGRMTEEGAQMVDGVGRREREVTEKRHYRDLGIIGEPYFDIDFKRVGYLTDTGRTWRNGEISVRDKVDSTVKFTYKSTRDVVAGLKRNELPTQIMITIHPQRWNDEFLPWSIELFAQRFKNVVKRILVRHRG